MVGTAVYQVGLASSISAKNLSALNPGVQNTAPPRESGAAKAGDQPVDVEQGHHVERAVIGRKLERGRDVAGRGPDVGMRQRHDFRPRGGAGGVQDERDVIRFGGTGPAGGARAASPTARNAPAPACRSGVSVKSATPSFSAARKRRRCAARFDDQRLGLEILEVELEFVLADRRD